MSNPTQATRKTTIEAIQLYCSRGGKLWLPKCIEDRYPELDEAWVIVHRKRHGSMPTDMNIYIFSAEQAARDYAEFLTGGGNDGDQSSYSASYIVDNLMSLEQVSPLSFMAMHQLNEAGVTSNNGGLTEDVMRHIGAERISELKWKFDEWWQVAAEFEFCISKYPKSSPVYLAAAQRYNFFIVKDDVTAGYLLRDLEIAIAGAELVAQKAADAKVKAGEKGKAASKRGRNDRRMALLEAMETFAKRNPDMIAFGDKEIAKLSLPKCVAADPTLWAQGRKQVGAYLDEIRRGEAGPDAKARYHALFPPKTA